MIRKVGDLPPEVARRFVKDIKEFFAEENGHKRDEIAARPFFGLAGISAASPAPSSAPKSDL